MLRLVRRFGSDRRGNFGLLVAAMSVPLTVSVGVAMDLASIKRSQSHLQNSTDAAVLAVAREGTSLSNAQAYQIAQDYLGANLARDYKNLHVTMTGTTFMVEAEAVAETAFGELLGYGTWDVVARSTADIVLQPYEVGLVLDTTGSMAGGKLAAMKEAVLGLVDTMSDQVTDKDNLKFAVVPFSSFVNVGPHFAPKFDLKGKLVKGTGAAWLDLEGKSDVKQLELPKGVSRFEVFHNLGVAWAGCVETREPTRRAAYDVMDAAPGKRAESLFVPALSIDEPDSSAYRNSYIASSADPLDKSATGKAKKQKKYGITAVIDFLGNTTSAVLTPVPTTITATKGPNANCVTQPIMPLSSDYRAIRSKVGSLEAKGNTNIMEGVAWGWRVLSPGEPFTEGARDGSKTRKIMIVLTDGSNVFGIDPNSENKLGSSYSSFGFAADERLLAMPVATVGTTNSAMNDKTLQACANAKAAGVEIFTIRLEEPDKATGMMLKSCASDEAHFFDAPSRTQLDKVFGQIRDKITRIKLSS